MSRVFTIFHLGHLSVKSATLIIDRQPKTGPSPNIVNFSRYFVTPLMRIDAGNVKTGESRVHNAPGPTPAPASLAPTLDPS